MYGNFLISFIVVLVFRDFTFCFNIDTQNPIIIKNEFNGIDAHFGASLQLLPALKERGQEKGKGPSGWIFIGAPKGNSTHTNHVKIREPGVIWRCALGRPGMSFTDDCKVLHMDPTGEYDPKNPNVPHTDRKDGAWIGGTMASMGDRFVSCGSRWVNKKFSTQYLMNGICYWVPKSNVLANDVNPSWPWLPPKYSYRLLAFLNSSRQTFTVRDAGKPWTRFDWQLGQMGFSINMPDSGKEMILGAPGVFEWTGSVVQFRDSMNGTEMHTRYNKHPSSSVFSEYLVAQVREPGKASDFLGDNDYFGYSVTSGKYFHTNISSGRTQYAAGAPRSASHFGKVLIFSFKDTTEPHTTKLDYLVSPIQLSTEYGGGYGSYFGSTLVSLDLNGDGFDDLLIAAPQFTLANSHESKLISKINFQLYDESTQKRSLTFGDEGCVFIYISQKTDFSRNPQQICGDNIPGSRFGSSMVAIGDANLDGFKDFAVGAPYENENRGAVYIYHGGKERVTFTQKILPQDIDSQIRTFGYSLASGDIDDNGYSDLAVGAYSSNHALVFRTIPMIKFNTSLSTTVAKILPDTREFDVVSCIAYSGHNLPEALWVKVEIEIINPIKPENNATEWFATWFVHEGQGSPNALNLLQPITKTERVLYIPRKGTCLHFRALIIKKLDDRSREIQFHKTVWMHETGTVSEKQFNPINYIIKSNQSGQQILQVDDSDGEKFESFKNKLPLPERKNSSSDILILPIGTVCEADEDPTCTADLQVSVSFKDSSGRILRENEAFVSGTSPLLVMDLDLQNTKELAKSPIIVDVMWNISLKIRINSPFCEQIHDCNNTYRCTIHHPLFVGQKEGIQFQLDMGNLHDGEGIGGIEFFIKATSGSEDLRKSGFIKILPVTFQAKLKSNRFEDNTIMPTANGAELFNFSQAVEIMLEGPSSAFLVRLEMDIPTYFDDNGKLQEFLLMRYPSINYNGKHYNCAAFNGTFTKENSPRTRLNLPFIAKEDKHVHNICTNPEFNDTGNDYGNQVPESGEQVLQEKTRRYKRAPTEDTVNLKQVLSFKQSFSTFQIRCGQEGISCMKVICDMKYFPQNSKAVIQLKLRLKRKEIENRIRDPEQNFNEISFETVGFMRKVDSFGTPFGHKTVVTAITKIELPPIQEIPLWIIITSIVCGILLLLAITLVLVKCGFFRRMKVEEKWNASRQNGG